MPRWIGLDLVQVVLICSVMSSIAYGEPTSQDLTGNAKTSALKIANELYGTLRNVVAPSENVLSGEIESRFLMLMPGKVLNYFDYFPGKEYTKFIQDYDTHRRESVVPPHVMEKWFDLADNVPSPHPMNAQDTGKSLANVYQSILHETELKGYDEKTQRQKQYYSQGVRFLNGQIPDPENLAVNVTRLALYERYRDQYNDRKLNMEDEVESKRKNYGSLDYELWFQRHYPSLQSKVESAYTKWLVFGQKELVELNIAYMDTGTSAPIIEEARAALRASGVESLDRTRMIYPVSFEPSDWYKYLLPQQQRPSRDQLQVMLGKLQSRLDVVEATIQYVNQIAGNTDISQYLTTLNESFLHAKQTAGTKVQNYLNSKYQCMIEETGKCKQFAENTATAVESLVAQSDAYTRQSSFLYLTEANGGYVESLSKERSRLRDEISRIYSLLGEASPYLGGIVDASPLAIANLTDEYRDDQWLQFEYSSKSSYEKTDDNRESSFSETSGGFHFLFFGGGGSSSSQREEHDHEEKAALADITVKGELLRVTIKRPWFKPELFDDPSLTYREGDDDGHQTFVSPGREFTKDDDYYQKITGSDQRFKLPEYISSFILARNIEIDFAGLDSSTSTYYMSEITKSSGGGGFLFFHVHHSETKTKQVSHVVISKTASGMNIKIPGAQIIGYFTEVVPKFPQDQ